MHLTHYNSAHDFMHFTVHHPDYSTALYSQHCNTTTPLHATEPQPLYSTEFLGTACATLHPHCSTPLNCTASPLHSTTTLHQKLHCVTTAYRCTVTLHSTEFHCTAATIPLHCPASTTTLHCTTPLYCTHYTAPLCSTALHYTHTTHIARCSALQRSSSALHDIALYCMVQ